MYIIYILQSLKDKRTYTGYTKDLKNRLYEHNTKKVTATKNRVPFKILYTEKVITLDEAKKREKYWKCGGGRRKLKEFFTKEFPPINL